MKKNTITYEQIEKRLKNKPMEEWTKDDVFDRYVGYGNPEELEDVKVQKLFIKHGLCEELIDLIDKVIKNKNIKKIEGKIKDIKFLDIEDDDIDELKQISIIFEKTDDKEQIEIKDFCFTSEIKQYLQDKNKYENKEIIAIIEVEENQLNLKCFCEKIV